MIQLRFFQFTLASISLGEMHHVILHSKDTQLGSLVAIGNSLTQYSLRFGTILFLGAQTVTEIIILLFYRAAAFKRLKLILSFRKNLKFEFLSETLTLTW